VVTEKSLHRLRTFSEHLDVQPIPNRLTRHRVDIGLRGSAGAHDIDPPVRQMTKDRLGHLRTGGVAGADEQHPEPAV